MMRSRSRRTASGYIAAAILELVLLFVFLLAAKPELLQALGSVFDALSMTAISEVQAAGNTAPSSGRQDLPALARAIASVGAQATKLVPNDWTVATASQAGSGIHQWGLVAPHSTPLSSPAPTASSNAAQPYSPSQAYSPTQGFNPPSTYHSPSAYNLERAYGSGLMDVSGQVPGSASSANGFHSNYQMPAASVSPNVQPVSTIHPQSHDYAYRAAYPPIGPSSSIELGPRMRSASHSTFNGPATSNTTRSSYPYGSEWK